jgi:hypothetical protein
MTSIELAKHKRSTAGWDGHLTRKQAAQLLGLASEYKIRQFEREGLLHSVRGAMQTAFYPRAEILALKARIAGPESGPAPADAWSDAELLALLGHPAPDGKMRTALDLVLETNISIERAERVFAFWSKSAPALASAAAPTGSASAACATTSASMSVQPTATAHAPASTKTPPRVPVVAAPMSGRDASSEAAIPPERAPIITASTATAGHGAGHERRGTNRLSRDSLIRDLRDPDPRIRERAFARLKESGEHGE